MRGVWGKRSLMWLSIWAAVGSWLYALSFEPAWRYSLQSSLNRSETRVEVFEGCNDGVE